MVSLFKTVQALESLYPLDFAESWDEPGLIVGDMTAPVKRIVCASDPTLSVVKHACDMNADLLVTHHPLFFRSVHEVSGRGVRGEIVRNLIENHCGLWVGHTNADSAWRGVAHAAADAFGLINQHPLVPAEKLDTKGHEVGLGRIGELENPISLREFANKVFKTIPHTEVGIQVCGDIDAVVSKIAVLPGSGDSLFDEVRASGAEVYVTSDLRHHPALDAIEQARYEFLLRKKCGLSQLDNSDSIKPMLINTPHSAIESLWFNYAVEDIENAIKTSSGEHIEVIWLKESSDPWNYVIR